MMLEEEDDLNTYTSARNTRHVATSVYHSFQRRTRTPVRLYLQDRRRGDGGDSVLSDRIYRRRVLVEAYAMHHETG